MHVEYITLSDNSGEHVKLTEVDYKKDLGVWITSNLKSSLLRQWHQL